MSPPAPVAGVAGQSAGGLLAFTVITTLAPIQR
jgi:hypothetical protein